MDILKSSTICCLKFDVISTKCDAKQTIHKVTVQLSGDQCCHNTQCHLLYLQKCRYSYQQLVYFLYCLHRFPVYRTLVAKNVHNWLSKKYYTESTMHALVLVYLNDCDCFNPVDRQWCYKILRFSVLRMEVEESLSWLSTLGGAFSSLGDRNIHFAKKAGQISLSQLRLSCLFGDSNLIARCYIYMCHSLCQQGQRKRAIQFVRKYLYPYLMNMNGQLERIVAQMYSSLRFRIMFIYK